jgi:hypothetical protein
MLLNLTELPSQTETAFLNRVLNAQPASVCLVSSAALPLLLNQKPFTADCVVRTEDANKLGGKVHDSWRLISDDEWLTLTETHRTVSW